MASLEEGVLRVLYEGPATVYECAAGLLQHGHATQAVPDEIEALVAGLVKRGCVVCSGGGSAGRYSLTPAGSERLAALVESI